MQIILIYDHFQILFLNYTELYKHFLCTFKNAIFLVRINLSSKQKIAWRHDVAPERALSYVSNEIKIEFNSVSNRVSNSIFYVKY